MAAPLMGNRGGAPQLNRPSTNIRPIPMTGDAEFFKDRFSGAPSGPDYSAGTEYGEAGAPSLGEPGSDGMTPEQLQMVGGLAKSGIKGVGKMLGTLIALNEAKKNRLESRRDFDKKLELDKRSAMLEYLLSNEQYADKLTVLRSKLMTSAKNRSSGQQSMASRAKARSFRR